MENLFRYIVKEEDKELRIKELLKRRLGFSSRLLAKLKRGDHVFLNGQLIKMYEKGIPGDEITVTLPREISDFEPQAIPIEIIYEDRALLLLNKQPGYVVHPTKGHPDNTIANGVMRHMLDRGESYKIRFINRLDRDTSGVLLIGKNSHSQDYLTKQFQDNTVVKKYMAVVKGILEDDNGTIDEPIGRPVDGDIKRTVMPDGAPSVTHYRVLERFKEHTLVELTLETGRTHQIRVHMTHIGHPIVGDDLYGDSEDLINRQALHASQVIFDHPVTKERMSVSADLPQDIKLLIQELKSK
ncbi:MAG: RluA family pseudouridine synthase [Clostridiales bacterium]|jgi:23S rRNA pseudouridine1911/1915/1917 synthase|nr:RluA family pseudouridine synthase [Clostridiales bacterium]